MRFVPFELERWQSTWENRVRYNLSESGVHPLSIRELLELAGASREPLLDVRLGYSQSNGTDLLRSRIAALYPGVAPDQTGKAPRALRRKDSSTASLALFCKALRRP